MRREAQTTAERAVGDTQVLLLTLLGAQEAGTHQARAPACPGTQRSGLADRSRDWQSESVRRKVQNGRGSSLRRSGHGGTPSCLGTDLCSGTARRAGRLPVGKRRGAVRQGQQVRPRRRCCHFCRIPTHARTPQAARRVTQFHYQLRLCALATDGWWSGPGARGVGARAVQFVGGSC